MTGTPVPIGVVRFPGTNCDQDVFDAVGSVPRARPVWLWHKERDLAGVRAIVLAGGFAYGDYLRAGAIARFSPIMEEVIRFAEASFAALIMIRSSIRCWSMGAFAVWTMNMSAPRIDSS